MPSNLQRHLRASSLAIGIALGAACSDDDANRRVRDAGGSKPSGLAQLEHFVVIYLENHSFDNLYGSYPGAEGLAASSAQIAQIDPSTGAAFETLPQTDLNVPLDLANAPFDITRYVPAHQTTVDLVHRFYQEQAQINAGKMDRFVGLSDAKGLSLGYYPTAELPVAKKLSSMPEQVTVLDHFFHAAFGGSFLNHIWLIAAASPTFPGAPDVMVAKLNDDGSLLTDAEVTPDGYVVNTSYAIQAPHPEGTPPENLVPIQTMPTIGDRLSEKSISWAWYAGGWDDALAGVPDVLFQFHHQPFAYFAPYADGSAAKAEHLKDERDFFEAARAGALPAVAFIKPIGAKNQHPGYTTLEEGENHVVELIDAVMNSGVWDKTAIIVTYDENGGFWDHVAPPKTDEWGPGTRIPALVISPFAKGGVDSTVYDTTAIMKLFEERWQLAPVARRDAAQASLAQHAFRFP